MNIQTEHLDDHRVQFTVEVEAERFEKAKRKVARKIAKGVNIPGFRKGKAPYNILVQYGFEANIVNDAIDDLTQVIYRETLEQAEDIEPYGPGALEDIQLEENSPKFIYTVPLQPRVELGEYRDVRVDYEEPEITDDMVEAAMKQIQRQQAVIEESSQPVAVGDRVTIDIHSEFADGEEREDEDEDADLEDKLDEDAGNDEADDTDDVDEDDDEVEETPPTPYKGDPFIHEHDAAIDLDPEDEPIMPGFIDALVGVNVGDTVEFELTVPEQEEDVEYQQEIVGRKVHFSIEIKKVENVTLPELNDELAARITEEEDEPLTLLQLRMRVRENMEQEAENRLKSSYAMNVLDDMVAVSALYYPEAMVEDQIDNMLGEFEQRLSQQGLSMDTYMEITNSTREDLGNMYRESAVETVERSLVLSELVTAENIKVKDSAINARIDEILSQFGEQADSLRGAFDTPSMRNSIVSDLTQQKIMDRIIAIGKGEEIIEDDEDDDEVEIAESTEADEAENEVVDTVEDNEEDAEENETLEAAETAETVESTDDDVVEETSDETKQ